MNLKAALLLCTGIISVVPTVVNRVETPAAPPYATIGAGQLPPQLRSAWASAGLDEAPAGDWRSEWARNLARPSPLEAAARLHEPAGMVALAPPVKPPAAEFAATLPPLVFEPPAVLPPAIVEATEEQLGPLAQAEPAPAPVHEVATLGGARTYALIKGDTLLRITRREWNSADPRLLALLLEDNPQLRGRESRLAIGECVVIPNASAVQRALAGAGPAAGPLAAVGRVEQAAPQVAAALPKPTRAAASVGKTTTSRWYTIKANDSLASVARRQLKDGGRWREIAALNKLDPRRMLPGKRIKLPPLARAGVR
ncbi:MAG: LysM peptidoglycan-binding domain-containing protein [Planctomycetota bacterium]